ncbi:MAG TPA: sensor histidine kinase [Ktedonobacteraceae bacterium]|nr:sensor histidine kinase [Ktedonobacteraceae bacterium]
MLAGVDITSNEQFQRKFRYINLLWLGVLIVYMTIFVAVEFINNPAYLHGWRGIAIIGLSALMVAIYLSGTRIHGCQWPPRLSLALSVWISMYLIVILLSTINNDFVWCLYIVYGVSFTLFGSRRLIIAVCILALTLFAYQGLLVQPWDGYNPISIIGQSVGLFSMTLFSMLLQRLIHERYERNTLLQQLTEANKELEEAQHQLAESALQEQELAVLRERTRLARDMHDTLGHALVLVSVKLEAAQGLRTRDPERCDRELESTKEIVRESMRELRASIANLRSPALEREPACRALSRYAREMAQRANLRVTYDLQPDIEGLPDQIEETLWKVGQEALTNIEKHAAAHNVTLHISRDTGSILMRIQDDGIGIHLPSSLHCPATSLEKQHEGNVNPEGHYGLCGMHERVENVSGHITITDTPITGGTTVEFTIPLIKEPDMKNCLVV